MVDSLDPWRPPRPGTFEAVLTGLQFDRVRLSLGDECPEWFVSAARYANPRHVGTISDTVYVHLTRDEAMEMLHLIQNWLVRHPIPLSPLDERRAQRRANSAMVTVARRIEIFGRLPHAVSQRMAESAAHEYDPSNFMARTRTGWILGEVEQSMAWVERHRAIARAMEFHPTGHRLAKMGLRKALSTQGLVSVEIPEWWTLIAPTAPFRYLPSPGDDPFAAARLWYTEARTTPRLAKTAAVLHGPTRWALLWSWSFIAECASYPAEMPNDLAVRQAWQEVADGPDPFDGEPFTGIDLLAETEFPQRPDSPNLFDRMMSMALHPTS